MKHELETTGRSNKVNAPTRKRNLFSGKQRIFYIFCILIFILGIVYFSEIRSEFRLLEKVKVYWLALAILAQVSTYLLAALVYWLLLRAYEINPLPRLSELFRASIIFLFFNQTVPSAGVSGNTFFFNFLVKRKISPTQALSFMRTELLIFYATMEVVILVLLLVCSFIHKVSSVLVTVLALGLLIHLVLGLVILWVGRKKTLGLVIKKIGRLKWFKKYAHSLNQRWQSVTSQREVQLLAFFQTNTGVVVQTFFLQVGLMAADAFTLLALFYGLGVPVPVFVVVLSFICTKILATLPISPGSLILYESSMTFFLVHLGTSLGPAIVVTLLYRLLSFWMPIPVGLFFYRKWLRGVRI